MSDNLSLQIVVIAVVGVLAQWSAWKLHVPAIIFLLAAGFIVGPMLDIVQPEVLLGDFLSPAIGAAVAIILFEGALHLHFKELRETQKLVRHVIILGAPIGWLLIALAAHYVAGLAWPVAVTLGGMLVVTGPTVIMPMLRGARLNKRVSSVFKWEGIVNDPVGVICAILAYEYFHAAHEGHAGASFFLSNGLIIILTIVVSYAFAHFVRYVFERGAMPEYLKTPFLFSAVLTLFFACNEVLHESGLIAVTVLGLALGNMHIASIEDIRRFKETVTIMLVSGVFILLTANLDAAVMLQMDIRAFAFVALLLFVIRPITIFLATIGTNASWQEKLMAGLIAPRGIVCAAMAGVIGPLLFEAGYADGDKILPISFAVVVISVVLHSLMIKPLGRALKLTATEQNGVIIAGAYKWSIQLAETLQARGVPVLVVDNNWHQLGRARLAGVPVYYGELLSDETEFNLEFSSYDMLIAATTNPAYNALLYDKFSYEMGAERVFSVNVDTEGVSKRRLISSDVAARPLLDKGLSLAALHKKIAEGWQFKAVRVGKKEGEDELIIPHENQDCLHLGMIGKSGLVTFFSSALSGQLSPKEDDVLLTLEKAA